MDRSDISTGWSLSPALVAGLFAIALSPLVMDHVLFHPDERHYVDGALQLLETGEWLTPRTADGELRLHKPVLAYWFAACGALFLEPSPFSTRILFLLAGAATIWCGARATFIVGGSRQAAMLTAIVLACHPALMLSSTRSLPDILLGMFITVSMTGFLAIIVRRRADWSALVTAYLGGALAVLSKGSPAIVFVAYATAYLCWFQSTLVRAQWRRIVVAVIGCALFSGSWFAAMQSLHGNELTRQFVVDQGAPYRFAAEPLQVLFQAVLCLALLAISFGTVIVPISRPAWIRRGDMLAIASQSASRFLIGWSGLFLVCAACINHVSLRYLIPVVVPMAVLLGLTLVRLEGPLLRRNLRWCALLSIGLLGIAGIGWGVVRAPIAPMQSAFLLACVAGGVWWLWRQLRFTSLLRSSLVIGGAWLGTALLTTTGLLLSHGPSFGFRVAEAISEHEFHGEQTTLTLIGEPAHASRIRICSGGRIRVEHIFPRDAELRPPVGPTATAEDGYLVALPENRALLTIPFGFNEVTLWDASQAWWDGNLSNYIKTHQRVYHVAIPDPVDDRGGPATRVVSQPVGDIATR